MAQPIVQLRYATLPSALGWVSVHHWFAVYDPERDEWNRWEVWQDRDVRGESWGHLHRNLKQVDHGVGGGPMVVAAEWRGAEAEAILRVLLEPERYPWCEVYRYWPGPNSNTYAAWVLREAGVTHRFCWRGWGSAFHRRRHR